MTVDLLSCSWWVSFSGPKAHIFSSKNVCIKNDFVFVVIRTLSFMRSLTHPLKLIHFLYCEGLGHGRHSQQSISPGCLTAHFHMCKSLRSAVFRLNVNTPQNPFSPFEGSPALYQSPCTCPLPHQCHLSISAWQERGSCLCLDLLLPFWENKLW